MESESDTKTIATPAHRRGSLGYLNYAAAVRRLRYSVTREKLIDSLKAMIWVIPLSLLIWIYAESEQIVVPNLPNANGIEVNFKPGPNRFLEPAANPEEIVTVNLKLTGPQAAIDKVKSELNSAVPRGVSIDTSEMPLGKNQPIIIVDRIQDLPVFKNNGVTVLDSDPKVVRVNIDSLTNEEVPVEIAPADVTKLSSQTQFEPAKVSVQGPKTVLQELRDAKALHVYADLTAMDLKTAADHAVDHSVQSVQLKLAAPDPRLQITPGNVNATLVVASNASYDAPFIPIVVDVSASTLKTYDVTSVNNGEVTLGTTTLTGPADQIDAIKSAQFAPKAVVELSKEDADRGEHSYEVKYDLPPGVHVEGSNADRKIEVIVTRRTNPG